MTIFVDTNIFVSYYNKEDENHEKAIKVVTDIESDKYGDPFTSDYIFDECITVTLYKTKNINLAINLGDNILKSFHFIKVNNQIFIKAWDNLRLNRINISFTDLTSLAITELLPIKRIATFDKEFKRFKHIEVIDG